MLRRRTSDDASERPSRFSSIIYDPRLAAVLTVLTAGTLLLTQSRGALVSAAAGFGLLVWLRWPRLRPVVAIGSVVAIALVSMAVAMEISAGKQVVLASDFSVSAADNFAVRIDTWHSALWALSQHPVEGVGLDAFRHLLPTTYPAASIPNTYDIGHAHNQFIQAALDLGLPGLLGYLALWFAAWRMVWLMLRTGGATRAFPWGKTHPQQGSAPALPPDQTYDLRSTIYDLLLVGFAAALFASFLHGMIDVVVMVSKPGVLFWAMLALISALWRLTANERVSTLQE
jgi:O-antigen ligase